MTKKPRASIIIAKNSKNHSYNKFITRCIYSIKKNTFVNYELIIEDGSIDGPAKARNIAATKVKGKYLVFLDYDTIVNKNWLADVVSFLDKKPDIGGGQLKLLRMDRKNIYDSAGEKLTPFGFLAERAQSAEDKGQFDKVESIFSGKGAAMIVRRTVFEKIGGFDEDYFMYWEEPDLAWRIWKAGYKFVFLPMGTVYHAYGTKHKTVSRKWDIQITYLGCRNHITTIIKNGADLRGLVMLLSATIVWIALFFLFLAKLNIKKAEAVLQALFFIVQNLKGIFQKRASLIKELGKKYFSDKIWLPKIIDNRGIAWYFGKGISYVLGKPF